MEGNPSERTITLGEDDLKYATFKLSDFGEGNSTARRYHGTRLTSSFLYSESDVLSR
jgi:hypothetical protein